jgi:hypothetical protein
VKAYKDGGPALNEWNIAGLKTAVNVDGTLNDPRDTDRSWTVEIAMPWIALAEFSRQACPPRNGDRWRVDFSRVEWQVEVAGEYRKVPNTREDNWVWSPTGIIDMHRPEKWGLVEFTSASVARHRVKPGPLEKARDSLQEIYYAERAFHAKTGRFSDSAAELGLTGGTNRIELLLTTEGWVASLALPGHRERRHAKIRQDAYFWIE